MKYFLFLFIIFIGIFFIFYRNCYAKNVIVNIEKETDDESGAAVGPEKVTFCETF